MSSLVEISPTTQLEAGTEKPEDKNKDQGSMRDANATPYRQDAFGNEESAEVRYKTLEWWQCGLLMVAGNVSLGVLSLPAVVASLGLVPAVILIVGLGILATYTGYVIGQFKWRFPHISSVADAGEVLMGRFGKELFFVGQMLKLVFNMASHILTFTVAMNTITDHGTCSLVFGVVGLVISFVLSLPRTMNNVSWLSLVSFTSIIAAVVMTMIVVGIKNPGGAIRAIVNTSLVPGFTAIENIVFSYAAHIIFFSTIAELKEPRDFPKALVMLQSIDVSLYVTAAVVIYYYVGDNVASPALGSAGPLLSKVAYGIALPTIIISGVVSGHVAFKTIYIRIFAGTNRMQKRDFVAVGSWVGIALILWVVAWVIASAIPVFNNLLSLISALFASWFTFGFPGMFWLYMNKNQWSSSPRKIALTFLNVGCVCVATILCGLGLYTSGKAIHDNSKSASFSCANNA